MTVDSGGGVYVADSGSSAIYYWGALAGGYQNPNVLSGAGTGLCSPKSLATDSYKNVYVLDACGSPYTVTVYKPFPNSSLIETITLPAGAAPYQIAVDSSNRLFVSDPAKSDIYIYAPSTTSNPQTVSTGGYGAPSGIAVAPNGNVFVYASAEGESIVYVFKQSGNTLASPPVAAITGSNTNLTATTASLAADAALVYVPVGNKILAFGTGTDVLTYGSPLQSSNVTPSTITQNNVEFGALNGVAVSP